MARVLSYISRVTGAFTATALLGFHGCTSARNDLGILEKDDILFVNPTNDKFRIGDKMVSLRYVLRNGQAPLNNFLKLEIDLKKRDALTDSIQTIINNSETYLKMDSETQALLTKPVWDKKDREKWEEKLSAVVSLMTNKIPGLDRYRTPLEKNDVKPIRNLNALSSDIKNKTHAKEYDCDIMSVIEGVAIQTLEDKILSTQTEPSKRPQNYYLAAGYHYDSDDLNSNQNGHAWIMSSATSNIIESTDRPIGDDIKTSTPYMVLSAGNFIDFVKGQPIVTSQYGYAVWSYSKTTAEEAKQLIEAQKSIKLAAASTQPAATQPSP